MGDTEFDRQALDRLPLAEACLTVLAHVLEPADLRDLYARHRARGYQGILRFEDFVALMRDCLIGPDASARSTLLSAADRGGLPVSMKAFYDKLGHMDPAVGAALLAHAHDRLKPLLPEGLASPLPRSLQAFSVLAFDGKVVKHVPRRLRPLRLDRQSACKLLGGKALAAIDLGTGLPVAMHADLDGEASEGPLFVPLLERIRGRVAAPLVIADRGFGLFEYAQAVRGVGGQFLLRQHGSATFVADPESPAVTTQDRHGRAVTDEAGWLMRGKGQAEKLPTRRVTVERGAEALRLVTSLADAARYPADDLAEAYRHRWDIERMFSDITTVFGLRHLIGTRPEAGLFQAAFCLVLAGVLQVVRRHVAASQRRAVDEVSAEMLWRDTRADLTAAFRVIPPGHLAELIQRGGPAEQTRARLAELLGGRWKSAWAKRAARPFDPNKPATKPVKLRQKKGHDSVHRVLGQHRAESG